MKTSKWFFNLSSFEIVKNCFDLISELISQDKTPLVTIEIDSEKARTNAQNRLYWLWVKTIGESLGNDKDTQHTLLKRQFLVAIYAKEDGEMAQLVESMQVCKSNLNHQAYEQLATNVIKQISTTKATTVQFSEYLGDIERWAYQQNIILPTPQELIWAIR